MTNVPAIRFPEFSGEWKETTLKNECTINPTSDNLKEEFVYVDLESVEKGELTKKQIIEKENAPCRAQRVLQNEDILFQCVRPYQKNNYLVKNISSEIQWIASTGYAQLRTGRNNPAFIYHLLNTSSFNKKVIVRCTGSSYPAINSDDLSKIHFYICDIEEQKRIADFLSLLDVRIAIQNKIINRLQSLIKGLAHKLTQSEKANIKISDCLECYSSTLQEDCIEKKGTYPIYGAMGLIGYKETYTICGESILIIKDGSGVGSVTYAIGEYSVIGTLNFLKAKADFVLLYLYYVLMVFNFQPYKTGMAIPHIYFKDYGKAKIYCPPYKQQEKIAKTLFSLEQKLCIEEKIYNNLFEQKSYLLQQMFI